MRKRRRLGPRQEGEAAAASIERALRWRGRACRKSVNNAMKSYSHENYPKSNWKTGEKIKAPGKKEKTKNEGLR